MVDSGDVPPHSLEAEEAVIAACIVNGPLIPKVAEAVSYDQFYSGENRKYFQTLVQMAQAGEPVDVVTFGHRLRSNGMHVDAARIVDIFQMSAYTSIKDVMTHAGIIAACAVRRKLCDIGRKLTALALVSKDDVLLIGDRIKGEIDELAKSQPKLNEGPRLASEGIKALVASMTNAPIPPIPTGLPNYDKLVKGGWRKGQLVVIAGRPGMGKTAAALGLALHAAREGHGVVFFSMEMTEEEVMQRAVSYAGRINLSDIIANDVGDIKKSKFEEATARVASFPIAVDERPGLSLKQIEDHTERMALQFEAAGTPLKLVVVDYLQLVDVSSVSKKDDRQDQDIEKIAYGLKAIAKRLGVTVLALAQFNREADNDTAPSMRWLAGGSGIEKAADNLTFLLPAAKTPPLGYDPNQPVKVKWWIAKQRNGPAFTAAYMWFLKPYTRFEADNGSTPEC